MKKSTQIIHDPYVAPEGFQSTQPGVFKASTVYFKNAKARRELVEGQRVGYAYGLDGTPTTYTLEQRIAHLEGGEHCALACSGLAAINMVNFALLKTGDQLLLPENVYEPSLETADGLFKDYGVVTSFYDPMKPESLKAVMTDKAKLVWLEAPGSVTMEFPAFDALARIAREGGAYTALDTTWAAGLAFCGFDFDVDMVVQALTKYPSGGGDVLMGSVVTRNEEIHQMVVRARLLTGMGISANDAELVLRSLPTMSLRYHKQFELAMSLAQWCLGRDEFSAVLHPALERSPGHQDWVRLSNQTGAGIFSVVFDKRYTLEQVERFIDALKLFKMGFSWGGSVSLVMSYNLPKLRKDPKWDGILVRFCIGLEDAEDLQQDVEQALAFL